MERHLLRQLIKIALATAPMIGLLLVTPVFLLAQQTHLNFFLMWLAISTAVMINWMINLRLIQKVNRPWTRTWKRGAFVCLMVLTVAEIVFRIIDIELPVESYKVSIIRGMNVVSINIIIYILIALTLARENNNKVELENARLRLTNLEAEFKLLKDQINPHFLFNALSTAKSLVRKQPELAEEYIVRLSEFLRASINNNQKTVSLKEELALCTDYIDLNRIRFGEAIQVHFLIEPHTERYSIPYFSLLSLLENAIKHNVFTFESPLHIYIETIEKELIVRNNRKPKFNLGASTKTGLHNLEERYRLLTGQGIEVEETVDSFLVKLALI